MMDLCVNNAGNGTEEKAALNGHTPLPDIGDFGKVVVIVCPIEEKNVPKSAADNTRQAAIESKVEDVLVPAAPVLFHDIVSRKT